MGHVRWYAIAVFLGRLSSAADDWTGGFPGSVVKADDESGLTERQVQRLHDTASRDHDNAAAIVLNGAAFEPTGWSCVLQ